MALAIGVDIGGTGITAGRVDASGAILAHAALATPAALDLTLAGIDGLIAELDAPGVTAIGIGIPGRVDARSGRILSGGFVDLSGPPLDARLRNVRGRTFFNDNDANMALVAERAIGAAKGLSHVAMLTLGTGVGGALMENGRIVHGRGSAGQLGHITVEAGGEPCNCGRRGCLETTSSGVALGRFIAREGLPRETTLEALLTRDDAPARAIVSRWAGGLRAGVDSLVAAFDPELVILGGSLGAPGVEALRRSPGLSAWYVCDVAPAKLGNRAGIVGAALAALERAS